jgi:hypothetical protein
LALGVGMSRSDAAQTEENTPMSKWLVLPMVVLAYVAATAGAAAPRDRDHDRLPDRWERKHHLSTTIPSAKRDPDGDRLTNRRELRLRTHPRRADTDRDRLRDGAEVRRFHTNPRRRDTDGDGFRDRCELRKGTHPRKRRSRPARRCSDSPQEPPKAPPRNLTPPPTGKQFPNRRTTGTPDGWVPRETRSTDLSVNTAGAVVEDLRLTNGSSILINVPNVTVSRVEIEGGSIWLSGAACTGTPALIEDSTMEPPTGTAYGAGNASIGPGNFTARRVEIYRRGEGWRGADCGGDVAMPLNTTRVEDSFTYIQGGNAWPACLAVNGVEEQNHPDGYQSYHARGWTFVNNTFVFANLCGSSPFFAGHGVNNPDAPTINLGEYHVKRMLVAGAGYTYRHQTKGSAVGLRIVNKGWYYGPLASRCSVLSPWEAKLVNIDVPVGPDKTFPADADYRVTSVVANKPCDTEIAH